MKKIVFILSCCLSILIIDTNAQTNVSGFISTNTTWNLAGSPYVFTGNALLSQGVTLTINPGVVVKFGSANTLQVDGELIAIGTAQNRITFTSNLASPQAGDWGRIQFSDSSTPAVFGVSGNYISGSVFKYCDVLYGGGIGNGEIEIGISTPYFNHCNIMYSSEDGVYDQGANSTFLFDTSSVKNCAGTGLQAFSTCNMTIQQDTIENNLNGGIWVDANCLLKINNNYFISNGNSQEAHLGAIKSEATNVIIVNNYFENNGGSTEGVISADGTPGIECNKFINNYSTCIDLQTGLGSTVSHNIFEGNTGRSPIISSWGNYGDIYFEENYIRNNTSINSGCCVFQTDISNAYLHINKNQFINNTGPSIVDVYSGNQNSMNFLDMKYNNFLDPGQIEYYNQVAYGSSNVTIDSNYWGGISTQHIDSAIYDYFDNGNFTVVFYTPILTAPTMVDTTCPASVVFLRIANNQATGEPVSIYPNPTNSQFTISFSYEQKNVTVNITNMLGQLVYSTTAKEAKQINSMLNQPPGLYFVSVINDGSAGSPQVSRVKLLINR